MPGPAPGTWTVLEVVLWEYAVAGGMAMLQPKDILAGVFGILVVYLLTRVFSGWARWMVRSVINIAVAVLVLWAWDRTLGAGFHIGINPITASVVGLLGVPGFLLVLAARALTLGW
ncbi:MAG: hypothetical protein C7B46_12425 [Sulfobacillus benefaciens]|uniref:SigmaK-factor processing regulatory BofA n=1 Tax=Sulfobacillus benefaciens TaxID=453960 RepID=A0A2T2XED8_9FIRM|nr:MAG: hypothetical protein C7B46_12425 [Sulfobacillus benefaciens]